MIIKIGKGKVEGKPFSCIIGTLDATLEKGMEGMTIKKIALQLAKQLDIKDGEINMVSIAFTHYKTIEEVKEDE